MLLIGLITKVVDHGKSRRVVSPVISFMLQVSDDCCIMVSQCYYQFCVFLLPK